MPPMSTPSDIALNMPNASLMYSTMTPTFGNLMFQIAPSQTGEVNYNFGMFPYMSLEALLFQQQINSPVQPSTIASGQHSGQQNIQGAYTVSGAAGQIQASIGTATTGTGVY